MLQQIIDRACSFLALSVIIFIVPRYLTSPDPYKCQAPFEAQWLEPLKQWQPPGCMLHNYRSHDLTACLEGRMVFIGDSTIREIFWAMAEKLDSVGSNRAMRAAEKHADITFSRDGIELTFSWDPYLNSTSLHRIVRHYESEEVERPAITIIGGGLWHIKMLGEDSFNHFNTAISEIVKSTYLHRPTTDLFPPMTFSWPRLSEEALVAIAPVRTPLYQSLSADRAATLTEGAITPLNERLRQLSADKGAPVVWSYSQMTLNQPLAYQEDGLHVVSSVSSLQADILLNVRCNSVLSSLGIYPMDKTCCSTYTQPNWIQMTLLAFSLGLLPLVTVMTAKGRPITIEVSGGRQAKDCPRETSPFILPFWKGLWRTRNAGTGTVVLLCCRSDSDVRQAS